MSQGKKTHPTNQTSERRNVKQKSITTVGIYGTTFGMEPLITLA